MSHRYKCCCMCDCWGHVLLVHGRQGPGEHQWCCSAMSVVLTGAQPLAHAHDGVPLPQWYETRVGSELGWQN